MEAKSKASKGFKSTNFFLDDNFISLYREKQPKWDKFEFEIYKRYYAHYIEEEDRFEEFWETLKRVVEGCFSLQKEQATKLGILWDGKEAQESGQLMFHTMWHFKFLDPGRFLLKFSESLLKYSDPTYRNRF